MPVNSAERHDRPVETGQQIHPSPPTNCVDRMSRRLLCWPSIRLMSPVAALFPRSRSDAIATTVGKFVVPKLPQREALAEEALLQRASDRIGSRTESLAPQRELIHSPTRATHPACRVRSRVRIRKSRRLSSADTLTSLELLRRPLHARQLLHPTQPGRF